LAGILSRHGLSVDSVEDTMEGVQNVLADQLEIEEAISDGQQRILEDSSPGLDEEVERELDALLKEEASRDMLAAMPSVPTAALPASAAEAYDEDRATAQKKQAVPLASC
jgi:hypothetical protein